MIRLKSGYFIILYFRIIILGARIFDLTVTSIDVIGPQQLVTDELAIHYIKHF